MGEIARRSTQILWDWTFGGLPNWLLLPGLMFSWSTRVRVEAFPVAPNDLPAERVLDIEIDPRLALQKQLTLPKSARKTIGQAVDLMMRQTLPKGGEDLIWRYTVPVRRGTEINLDIQVLQKTLLQDLSAQAAARVSRIRTVTIADTVTTYPFVDARGAVDRPKRFWNLALVLLLLTVFGFWVWTKVQVIDQLEDEVATLGARQQDLASEAVTLRSALEDGNASFAAISSDVALFKAEYRLPILLDLTQTFSDETWIAELNVFGNALRLSGFTKDDITQVVSDVGDLPWVRRADLSGPVSFDSFSRRNRFELDIVLEAGEAP